MIRKQRIRKSIDRIVICSGKVYYDLYKERQESEKNNVAIARLEQFYPSRTKTCCRKYPKRVKHVKDIVWCQEEPKNMGRLDVCCVRASPTF
jgi:multifunctional 2-oxoglutarate metabolism enzyme